MTSPTTGAGTPTPDAAPTTDTVEAVQRALAAEHAAVWVTQLCTAFVGRELAPALAESAVAHRTRRDAADALLRGRGATPVAAEPAYATPTPVTDQASAVTLLTAAEEDAAAAWRSVVEHTDEAELRTTAATALVDAAVRATRWRLTAGVTPATATFPGG